MENMSELLGVIESIDWATMRSDEQTWVLRGLVKSARRWQEFHGLPPTIGSVIATSHGYCHCCRSQTTFSSSDGWLRDHYACLNCGSIPRERNIMRSLDELVPAWTHKVIHESSPSNMRIKKLCRNYSYSYYEENTVPGSRLRNGASSENLESLSIAAESFDVFITQDVLEHVFNPEAALKEITRVLRPGGWHIFTTPRSAHLPKTIQRASLENNAIQHILEPVYHGSPIGDGKALVTFDWGKDAEELFSSWTGLPVHTRGDIDQTRGIVGESFEVFAIQKTHSNWI